MRVCELREILDRMPPDAHIVIPKPDTHVAAGKMDLAETAIFVNEQAVLITN